MCVSITREREEVKDEKVEEVGEEELIREQRKKKRKRKGKRGKGKRWKERKGEGEGRGHTGNKERQLNR